MPSRLLGFTLCLLFESLPLLARASTASTLSLPYARRLSMCSTNGLGRPAIRELSNATIDAMGQDQRQIITAED